MADRGRKKTPAAITVLNGGKATISAGEKMPESPPDWLLADMKAAGNEMPDTAVRFWQTYAPKLNERGITDELHLPKFAMLCMAWAGWLEDPTDYKIINPARGLAAEFSMDPASAAKLGIGENGATPLGKMLKARGM